MADAISTLNLVLDTTGAEEAFKLIDAKIKELTDTERVKSVFDGTDTHYDDPKNIAASIQSALDDSLFAQELKSNADALREQLQELGKVFERLTTILEIIAEKEELMLQPVSALP